MPRTQRRTGSEGAGARGSVKPQRGLGAHATKESARKSRARRMVAEPAPDNRGGPVLLDIDGEAIGRLPATFEVLPGALSVFC